jgi:hypothetical protein
LKKSRKERNLDVSKGKGEDEEGSVEDVGGDFRRRHIAMSKVRREGCVGIEFGSAWDVTRMRKLKRQKINI